jgi:hypothetical protein
LNLNRGSSLYVLTRFLYANRYPPRIKCGAGFRSKTLGCWTNFATNAPHEKPNRKFKVCQFDAPRGDTKMRRECRPTNEVGETIAFRFHFQMANNGGRQACSVEVQASNIHDATTFFRQNWPMIESIARDGLLDRPGGDRTIKLAMPR